MALESATYVSGLVDTNPPGSDSISQGDDHIRLIKKVLGNSFPSSISAATVPDISGNGDKYLQVNSGATGTQWASVRQRGYVSRAAIEYSSTTQILIGAGEYEVDDGTTPKNYYWDSQLTFTIGSGGSNASSSDAGTSQWQYLYIDDSSISASPLVAASFLNSTTAPAYSQTKHGWYNGSDRCIFAFYIDSSGNIDKYYHSGSDYVSLDDDYTELAYGTATIGSWTPVSLTRVPSFSSEAELSWRLKSDGPEKDSCYWKWRTTGSSTSNGHLLGVTEGGGGAYDDEHVSANVRSYVATSITDTSKSVEYYATSTDTDHKIEINSNGFYLPGGM
jgi:hypothetical protein